MTLDTWLRPFRVLVWIVGLAAVVLLGGGAFFWTTSTKLDQALQANEQMKRTVEQHQAATQQQIREYKSMTDARLALVESNDRAQDLAIAILKEQMQVQTSLLREIAAAQNRLGDRLNITPRRVSRDYP